MTQDSQKIASLLNETRMFPPPHAFQSQANIKSLSEYDRLWNFAKDRPEEFWGEQARTLLKWETPFSKVLEWTPPHAAWFSDGQLNASVNCVDRHAGATPDKEAIIWEGEPGDQRVLTYRELLSQVGRCANALKALGVRKSDRVTVYMPLVPELAIAVLACARLGATHSVVFGGFSADALADRNNDAGARVVITADGGWRRGSAFALKENVDKSLERSPTVQKVLVLKRTNQEVNMVSGRDYWWHDVVDCASELCAPEAVSSEHPLFILYTSGTTGKTQRNCAHNRRLSHPGSFYASHRL